jgi:3-hydroxyisobutyrate dehydrogenase-like beta-hydroxyacid dehydrogenase
MIVGFIGLGTMGSNAARNVRRAGFQMVVHDIRPEAVERQLEPGVTAGSSPADVLARSDVVVTMVFGPKEVDQVVRGPNGFLSANCVGKYWVDMTTSSPRLMRALAAEFEAKGGHAVDAPVTGSVDAAIRGDRARAAGDRGHGPVAQGRPLRQRLCGQARQ